MNPVDSFLSSVREAFRPSEDGPQQALYVLGVGISSGLIVLLIRRIRARRRKQRAYVQYLSARGISPNAAGLLTTLGKRIDLPASVVASNVDAFERATAAELAKYPLPGAEVTGGIFAEVASLRRALGFHALPIHAPLLTTRELSSGDSIEIDGLRASIVEVNEAYLRVNCEVAGTEGRRLFPGARVPVSLTHGREARYLAECRVLSREEDAGGLQVRLAHDERPTRLQLRDAVRVPLTGVVHLRSHILNAIDEPSDEVGDAVTECELLDLSLGGLAVQSQSRLAVGGVVHVGFESDGAVFEDLAAVVLECEPQAKGAFRLRFEFHRLASGDEQKLSALITRLSARTLGKTSA